MYCNKLILQNLAYERNYNILELNLKYPNINFIFLANLLSTNYFDFCQKKRFISSSDHYIFIKVETIHCNRDEHYYSFWSIHNDAEFRETWRITSSQPSRNSKHLEQFRSCCFTIDNQQSLCFWPNLTSINSNIAPKLRYPRLLILILFCRECVIIRVSLYIDM